MKQLSIKPTIHKFEQARDFAQEFKLGKGDFCLLYTSPSPRDISGSRMPSSA